MIAIVAGTQNVLKNNKLRPTHSLRITMYLVGALYILSVICDAHSVFNTWRARPASVLEPHF